MNPVGKFKPAQPVINRLIVNQLRDPEIPVSYVNVMLKASMLFLLLTGENTSQTPASNLILYQIYKI